MFCKTTTQNPIIRIFKRGYLPTNFIFYLLELLDINWMNFSYCSSVKIRFTIDTWTSQSQYYLPSLEMSLTRELRCLLLCLCPCLGHKRNSIRVDTQQAHSTPILSVPGLWAMITYWSSELLGLQHFVGLIKRVFWQHMSSLLDPMTCWQWCFPLFSSLEMTANTLFTKEKGSMLRICI